MCGVEVYSESRSPTPGNAPVQRSVSRRSVERMDFTDWKKSPNSPSLLAPLSADVSTVENYVDCAK